jgi:hypothetical protein
VIEWQAIEWQANLESWKINDWALSIHGKNWAVSGSEPGKKSECQALPVNAVDSYHHHWGEDKLLGGWNYAVNHGTQQLLKCLQCGKWSGEKGGDRGGGGWNCAVKPWRQPLVKCFCGNRRGEGDGRQRWVELHSLALSITSGEGGGDRGGWWNCAVKPGIQQLLKCFQCGTREER